MVEKISHLTHQQKLVEIVNELQPGINFDGKNVTNIIKSNYPELTKILKTHYGIDVSMGSTK